MNEDIKTSYSAAGEIPLKVVFNENIRNSMKNGGMIPMTHIQLLPTNKCNLNCPWCSCGERDKEQEMSVGQIYDIMTDAKACGCESVTITGGGEPLLHPKINTIIHDICNMGMEVGLVTNGTVLEKLETEVMQRITWIRISSGDHRSWWETPILEAVERGTEVDWAFSHVVGKEPNMNVLIPLIEFANKHNFTHVRLVPDLFDLESVDVTRLKGAFQALGLDDSRVNYQDRQTYVKGQKDCLISLLKPVIGADAKVYACCGIQYAFPEEHKDLVQPMGEASDLKKIYQQQEHFDGSDCVKCYYEHYNTLLGAMKKDINHERFV